MTNTTMRSHHGYGHRHLLVHSSSILNSLETFAAADIIAKGSNLTDFHIGETCTTRNLVL